MTMSACCCPSSSPTTDPIPPAPNTDTFNRFSLEINGVGTNGLPLSLAVGGMPGSYATTYRTFLKAIDKALGVVLKAQPKSKGITNALDQP